jgi:hypothetical protein
MPRKKTTAPVITPAAALDRLCDAGGGPADPAARIECLVKYLHLRRVLAAGFAVYVDEIGLTAMDRSIPEMGVANGFAANYGLEDQDVEVLLLAHVEEVDGGAPVDVGGFFRRILERPEDPSNDDLPGQMRLPMNGALPESGANPGIAAHADPQADISTEEAPPSKKKRGRKQGSRAAWLGRWVRYRADKRTVIGKVTAEDGDVISLEDEQGEPWSNISRKRCKVLKDDPQSAAPAPATGSGSAPLPFGPPLVITLPAEVGRRYGDLVGRPNTMVEGIGPDGQLDCWRRDIEGGHTVYLYLVNGTPGRTGVYLVLHATDPEGCLVAAHPPIDQLTGTYRLKFGIAEQVVEVRVEEDSLCPTASV